MRSGPPDARAAPGFLLVDDDPHFVGRLRAEHRARRRAEAKLEHLAMHDGLTELPDRRLFEDRLASALKAAAREHCGVVLTSMDLNGFKPVNDTFGHHAGDLLLRLVGGRLREALRESDTVARLGGDEFGVLVPKLEGPPVVPPAHLGSRLLVLGVDAASQDLRPAL